MANHAHASSTGQDVQAHAPGSVIELDAEKGRTVDANAEPEDLKAFPEETPDYDAQRGIQKIEATTLAWSKWSLVALLVKFVTLTPLQRGCSYGQNS